MVTDPISDLLVRLQNGSRRRHDVVSIPASRLKREVLRILQNEGYIQGVQADIAGWAEKFCARCGNGYCDRIVIAAAS
ncbi:MAG: 30S ribosomal protein S8 [Nitrospira sp.]|nr:MAG: 30S ribosomal protein S8 [Nitrospira sp.]